MAGRPLGWTIKCHADILQNPAQFAEAGATSQRAESACMPEHLIDLKALLVERPDCDAGTVQQLRNALAQGGTQYRSLRDVTEALKKKLETAAPAQARTWHLKIGIASFFLGFTSQAIEHLRHADTALSNFYLG